MKSLGKVFLSHKSEDKDYVRYVAEKIGIDRCHYDEYTFESGMDTLSEIMSGLDSTDLFVLFISDKALDSEWVIRERIRAHKLLDEGKLMQIYPIIIDPDPKIIYSDDRIPKWMQEKYVIRKITSPKIAVQKIKARMRELTWNINPAMKSEQTYFFGRNQEIAAFEQRRGNLDKPEMVCCVASGFEGIGRKRYMEHCLKKSNILRVSNTYNLIQMGMNESVEDFILKISDLGIGEDTPETLSKLKTIQEKSVRLSALLKYFQSNNEIIFVNDAGSLITPTGELVEWLSDALNAVPQRFILGIASKYYLKRVNCIPSVFPIRISELSRADRTNMLREFCEQNEFELGRENLQQISDVLAGYPAQIFWAVSLLQDYGMIDIINHLHEIVDFSNDKAATVLAHFSGNDKAIDFLTYLSRFEIISADMLSRAFELDNQLEDIYNQFRLLSICSLNGSNGELICVSDVIRDYVGRLKRVLSPPFQELIAKMVSATISDKFFENTDLACYYGTVKQKIMNGTEIEPSFILPSIYIKSIVEFYNNRKYKKSCTLCKKLIENKADQSFDRFLRRTLYMYLCQSLAREHNDELFEYVHTAVLSRVDQLYLMGFFYRINNNPKKAIENLSEAVNIDGKRAQIKRELVNAYILSEDYESALQYSRDNFEQDQLNPYHAQSYFRCLFNSSNAYAMKDELEGILKSIQILPSKKAKQMYAEMQAQYIARFDGQLMAAYSILNCAIANAEEDKIYLLLAKFDISYENQDLAIASETYTLLQHELSEFSYFKNAIIVRHARLMKLEKKSVIEISEELKKLSSFPDKAFEKLQHKLLQ